MSQHEKNQRVVAELARHHSRIRYAVEIGSEFSLSHDDLETLLAALDEALGTVPKLEVVETGQTGRYMTVALVSYGTKRTLEAGKKQESELEKLRRHNKEMLALLENISAPRRGSEEASWEIPPRLVQLAARLVDEVTFEE